MPVTPPQFVLSSWATIFSTAYDALVAVLKEDPDLARVIRTWRSWDGGTEDLDPLGVPQMPWLVTTPSTPSIGLATVNDYRVDFPVTIDFAVPGTNVRHLMDTWGTLLQALRFDKPHRDATVGLFLSDHGTNFHLFTQAGLQPVAVEGGWSSRATLVMQLHVPA